MKQNDKATADALRSIGTDDPWVDVMGKAIGRLLNPTSPATQEPTDAETPQPVGGKNR